jgi:hypothetical protein
MPETSSIVHGVRILAYPSDGPAINDDRAAMDVIGNAISHAAELVIIPVERFSADFFQLRTRLAGDMLQKFVNYRLRLAIIGDLSTALAESQSLQAFVRESNRGTQVWFLSSAEELRLKLAPTQTIPS